MKRQEFKKPQLPPRSLRKEDTSEAVSDILEASQRPKNVPQRTASEPSQEETRQRTSSVRRKPYSKPPGEWKFTIRATESQKRRWKTALHQFNADLPAGEDELRNDEAGLLMLDAFLDSDPLETLRAQRRSGSAGETGRSASAGNAGDNLGPDQSE